MMNYLIIILIFLLAITGLLKEHILPDYKAIMAATIIVFLVILTGFQLFQEYRKSQKEWQEKWSGRLRSPVKSEKDKPVLKLGGSGLIWNGEPNKPIMNLAGEPLTIGIVEGRADLSIVIRDPNGIVLAAIRNNEWFVAPPPVTLDRNFNENSLEVLNPKGEVILQVQVYGEEVRIAGHFYNINGNGPVSFGPLISETTAGRLFKYPSAEHHGVLEIR